MKIKPSLYWRCQFIGWGLMCLSQFLSLWVLFGFGQVVNLMVVVNVVTGFPVSHLMRTVLVKLKVTQKPIRPQIIYFLGITLVFAVIGAFAWLVVISFFDDKFINEPNFWGRFLQLCNESFSLYLTWNFIYFTYHYVKNVRKKDQAKIEMQYKMFELEAFALRAQMNPHFIFNCLNSLKALMQEGETEKSIKYLITFSKLIRILFNNADKREISLYDEIETCKFYLQLEAMRFNSKFSHILQVEENIDLKSIKVPALIVQPFIENAIWHGIVPKCKGGNVCLSVVRKNGHIEIIVEDDGIGREESQQNKSAGNLTHQSKGVNLTQARLALDNQLQQRKANLEIIDKLDDNGKPAGTKVIININEESS